MLADLPPGTDISCWKWFHIWQIYPLVLTSHSQDEFKYGRSTPRSAGRSNPLKCWHLKVKMSLNLADLPLDQLADQSPQHWHLMVKMSSNLADLPLDQAGWSMPPDTDILWPRSVQIWQIYTLYLLTDLSLPVLTSCGQDDFKFGRSTPLVLTSHGQDEFKFDRSIPRPAGRSASSTDILWSRWVQIWHIYPCGTDISQAWWFQIWQM